MVLFFFFFLKILFIYFQKERKGGRKRGRETSMCGCLLSASYWGLACNPGMCANWESNQQPFGLQAGTQSAEWHQPGHMILFKKKIMVKPWLFWLSWSSYKTKGRGFDPLWVYIPRLQIQSPVRAHMGGNQSMFLSIGVSLSHQSLSFSLKKKKQWKN